MLCVVGAWLLSDAWIDPARRFVGQDFVDAYGTVWTWWWAGWALETGKGWEHTDLLFHPWGSAIFLHTGGNLLDALLSWPLRTGTGAVLGYNIWIVLVLATNGWVGSHVAAAVGAGPWGRWLGAAFGVLQPYALHEINLGRPTQGMLIFLGLWIASLLRPPSIREGMRGGVALLFCGLGYWYYGLLGAWFAVVLGLFRLVQGDKRKQELQRLVVAGAIAGLGVLPLVWPLLEALGQGEIPGLLALQSSQGPLGRLSLQTVEGDSQALVVLALDGRIGGLLDSEGLRFDPGVRLIHLVHAL
ncbi:MAG: hypothetical protein QGG40_00980, partial [Myxococcota bacterium]|nr:hypothetical protein [Myxococcota bacterium]